MRKYFLVFVFGLVTVLTATAGTEINVMVGHGYTNINWMKAMKSDYEKAYPNRKVVLNEISGREADRYTKAALMLRDSDKIDVLLEDSSMLKSDVNAGLLAPMSVQDWPDWNEYYPNFREFVTIDGKVYGIPLGTDVRGIYYNIASLKKAGIEVPWQPKNWNDIIDTAKKIKEANPGIIPFASPVAATGEATAMQTLEMLLYGTSNTLYDNGKWIIKSPGFLDSIKFVYEVYKDKLGPELGIAINAQYGTKSVYDLAPNQKIGLLLDGSWIMGVWNEKYKKTLDYYKFAPMPTQNGQAPGFTTMAGGWLISMNSKSSKKAEALEFIKFAVSKAGSLKYSLITNSFTTRKDVVAMSDYPKLLKDYASFVDFAHFRPANEKYPVVSAFIQKAVEAAAIGKLTPEQIMDEYANSVQKAVGAENVMTDDK